MARSWTFGRKVACGFAVVVALAVVTGVVAVVALLGVVAQKDRVIAVNAANLIDAERLHGAVANKVSGTRGFLLSGASAFAEEVKSSRKEALDLLAALSGRVESERSRRLLSEVARAEAAHQAVVERVMSERAASADSEAALARFVEELTPSREEMERCLGEFVAHEEALLVDGRRSSSESASTAIALELAVTAGALLAAVLLAFVITRGLGRQIGSAVQHVQNSSVECQAAANQQAAGARAQASSMTEIATTISELLVTSRQIADSSQRVAHIAGETSGAAGEGERMMRLARESMGSIKSQVDLTVSHMLELGRTSQQIGSVLDLITEMADQTNILAINATIEAAGAGDAGSRFAVVADEIRKLADRVANSTKEVRALIDGIRSSVNATVMATEGGSKAADAGARQFGEVTTSFNRIAQLVGTTTEAAREIELSTKQQASAVEQVNVAIANVAQATKETEASSTQTLQTASQLAGLSRELARLIHPDVVA